MAKLEDLKRGATVKGILPDCLVTVIDVKWHGSAAVELTYKDPAGKVTITVEIEAEIPSGAPDSVVRTVTENCRTLRFESQGFEEV